MSIFTHKNEQGIVDYHLIIKHNVGPDRKKVLFSNLPLELIEGSESNAQICKIIRSQNKRLEGMELELLQNLSKSIDKHSSLYKYTYPKEVLCGKILPTRHLLHLLEFWNKDMNFFPRTIVSKESSPMKQYVFNVMFERYSEFHLEKFKQQVIPITRGYFEQNMFTIDVWNEYRKFNFESQVEYFKTETFRGFECFILTISGKPVFEFVV